MTQSLDNSMFVGGCVGLKQCDEIQSTSARYWSQKLMASEGIADPWNASGLCTAACPLGGNGEQLYLNFELSPTELEVEDINGEVVNC
jgi:hypothetical protein